METNKIISRNIASEKMSIRNDTDTGKRYLEGYAIVFNQRSKLIREWGETFFEVIEPGAADNVLKDTGLNVVATIDHDRAKMIGRTKSGTLELVKDAKGLRYIVELPKTTIGTDIAEQVQRGDYFESSFIFSIAEKGVRYDTGEEIPVRYVSDIETLYDVSVVVDGAYANTAVALRAQEWELNHPTPTNPTPTNEQPETLDILQKELIIETLK
jgi:HK97 family phage prohead protease